MTLAAEATALAELAAMVTAGSPNEEPLRHELENGLEVACRRLGIPWTPYRLNLALPADGMPTNFADVVHGSLVIEYEPPRSFRGRDRAATTAHARLQAEGYVDRLAPLEGRPASGYVMVAWDGAHISFGKKSHTDSLPAWSTLEPFDIGAAARLLMTLRDFGQPLVSAPLVRAYFGPASEIGGALVPLLYSAVRGAVMSTATTRTKLLFVEWRRLFSQAVGLQTERLSKLAESLGKIQGIDYSEDPACWLFAQATLVAIVSKLITALAIPGAAQDIADGSVPVRDRLLVLEDGSLFTGAGIANFLSGDFFAWYLEPLIWQSLEPVLQHLVGQVAGMDFGPADDRRFARDLFKGLYEDYIPAAVRHSLGEYNTPDWLAEYIMSRSGWEPSQSLTDPTCGTGTFLLEALRLRRMSEEWGEAGASQLLQGISGFDINPLAVLAAKASLIVALKDTLDPSDPVYLPVYLTDTINPPKESLGLYRHSIQTEKGVCDFAVPAVLASPEELSRIFDTLRHLVESGAKTEEILARLMAALPSLGSLDANALGALSLTIESLVKLQNLGWDGIWCSILAERFSAASSPKAAVVVGNAPWVRWSNLPGEYAEFVKQHCADLGLLSDAKWVGGIESDICTLIVHRAAEWCLADKGRIAMLITGTVFTTESAQGFRRFRPGTAAPLRVESVEDFKDVAPFPGVSNHPVLLIARSGEPTVYPVPYTVWSVPGGRRGLQFLGAKGFLAGAEQSVLQALPVPGTDAGPWLKGTEEQVAAWRTLYGGVLAGRHQARKGITTDLNGVFWVIPQGVVGHGLVSVSSDPAAGRKALPKVRAVLEAEHLFPLLRGKGVKAFRATPDPEHLVLVPQRTMHGDPDLAISAPHVQRYLLRFKPLLEARSSFRRFQARSGKPWWSLWSTGPYTFAAWKVVWREFAGGGFAAAVAGPIEHPDLGRRVMVPDHKLYFLVCGSEQEAHYVCGVLNAPTVASAISSYGAQLSLGVSATEYLDLPPWDPTSPVATAIAELARTLHGKEPGAESLEKLDEIVGALFGYHSPCSGEALKGRLGTPPQA